LLNGRFSLKKPAFLSENCRRKFLGIYSFLKKSFLKTPPVPFQNKRRKQKK